MRKKFNNAKLADLTQDDLLWWLSTIVVVSAETYQLLMGIEGKSLSKESIS
jgi:hypothetical protein